MSLLFHTPPKKAFFIPARLIKNSPEETSAETTLPYHPITQESNIGTHIRNLIYHQTETALNNPAAHAAANTVFPKCIQSKDPSNLKTAYRLLTLLSDKLKTTDEILLEFFDAAVEAGLFQIAYGVSQKIPHFIGDRNQDRIITFIQTALRTNTHEALSSAAQLGLNSTHGYKELTTHLNNLNQIQDEKALGNAPSSRRKDPRGVLRARTTGEQYKP